MLNVRFRSTGFVLNPFHKAEYKVPYSGFRTKPVPDKKPKGFVHKVPCCTIFNYRKQDSYITVNTNDLHASIACSLSQTFRAPFQKDHENYIKQPIMENKKKPSKTKELF